MKAQYIVSLVLFTPCMYASQPARLASPTPLKNIAATALTKTSTTTQTSTVALETILAPENNTIAIAAITAQNALLETAGVPGALINSSAGQVVEQKEEVVITQVLASGEKIIVQDGIALAKEAAAKIEAFYKAELTKLHNDHQSTVAQKDATITDLQKQLQTNQAQPEQTTSCFSCCSSKK